MVFLKIEHLDTNSIKFSLVLNAMLGCLVYLHTMHFVPHFYPHNPSTSIHCSFIVYVYVNMLCIKLAKNLLLKGRNLEYKLQQFLFFYQNKCWNIESNCLTATTYVGNEDSATGERTAYNKKQILNSLDE